jgi:hypothetical protein
MATERQLATFCRRPPVFFCKTQLLHKPQNAERFANAHDQQQPVDTTIGVSDTDRHRLAAQALLVPDAHQADHDQRVVRQRIDMFQKSR